VGFLGLAFPVDHSTDGVRTLGISGGRSVAAHLRITRDYRAGKFDAGEVAGGPGGGRAIPKQLGAPSRAVDLDRLARAVALHETVGCTRGVGLTHNNCHGIRQNGEWVYFPSFAASTVSFKKNWLKHYGNHFPTFDDAVKYSGGDRADAWLKNVTKFYGD